MKSKLIAGALPIIIGLLIWFSPTPDGLTTQAWHLFAIFLAATVSFIAAPTSMGLIAFGTIIVLSITKTLTIQEALSGFSNDMIWLIFSAFILSRGFVKTELGKRIAFRIIQRFGTSPLRLAYTLLITDLILAPATPSNTARTGGIIYPITRSLAQAFDSYPGPTRKKIGAYLIQVIAQSAGVTSAMFVTANITNPLILSIVADAFGISITWGSWAIAALVPGIISLLLIPIILYKIYPPELKDTSMAREIAAKELKSLGHFDLHEKIMLGVFIGCLAIWLTATATDINPTTVALLGVGILLLTNVISWEDVKSEKNAWDTLVWMGTIIALATYLSEFGVIPWLISIMGNALTGYDWLPALTILFLVYFYSHYAFASLTAHVAALYVAMTSVAIALGAPVMGTLFLFAFASSLFSSITPYAAGSAPILYESRYITQPEWWKLGFIFSIIFVLIWGVIGAIWWDMIGIW